MALYYPRFNPVGYIGQYTGSLSGSSVTVQTLSASNMFVGSSFLLSANTIETNDLEVLENAIFSGSVDVTGVFNVSGTSLIIGPLTASYVSASAYYGGSLLATSMSVTDFGVTSLTASNILVSNNITVLGTASIAQLNTLNQNELIIGDKYITILSGAVDHPTLDESGIYWGSGSTGITYGDRGEHAHISFESSGDFLDIYPGLSSSFVSSSNAVIGNGISLGSNTLNASAIFEVVSTTKGV